MAAAAWGLVGLRPSPGSTPRVGPGGLGWEWAAPLCRLPGLLAGRVADVAVLLDAAEGRWPRGIAAATQQYWCVPCRDGANPTPGSAGWERTYVPRRRLPTCAAAVAQGLRELGQTPAAAAARRDGTQPHGAAAPGVRRRFNRTRTVITLGPAGDTEGVATARVLPARVAWTDLSAAGVCLQ